MINLEPDLFPFPELSSDCLLVHLRFLEAPVTDSGTAHRSRARRVHRAPHPRASTASLNPAERSAAEIHRESHRPRAARRGVRARPLDSTAEWGAPPSPGKAEPPKRAGDVSKPNASRVRVLPIARYRRYASHGRAFTRSQVRTRRRLPGFSSCPRLASCSPNPPRGVLSSTQPHPRLASSANDSRIAVPITRLPGEEPGARYAGRHALTHLPISTPSTSP